MNEEKDWSKMNALSSNFKFYSPPQPNWKLHFGDSTTLNFQFYIKNPPNRFQRWMIKKFLGITWEPVT